ncbi:GNAT family N-acetyltransferase [Sediminicola sp. 1XM1-17]|uniref:GNAT family N-acetyltransferase n=1 Tax=Sediminicola sp. 1XM1-17 TaxID=3127702 RepID=UPI003077C79D
MNIRKATIKDAETITDCLLMVLDNMVYKFIGEKDSGKAREFLNHFTKRENNQYSYQNCYIAENDHEIIGAINIYKGSDLWILRKPILEYSQQHYNTNVFVEDETQAGEYYIDTLAVLNKAQGKGIGTQLLQHAIDTYVNHKKETLGLLVDENNPKAKKLYQNLGFESVGKKVLMGHHMEHLQINKDHLQTNF